jgi:hypothetical protein
VQELEMLQSVEGAIRQNQSPANLRAQLQKVKDSQQRFLLAAQVGGPMPSGGGTGIKILSIEQVGQ